MRPLSLCILGGTGFLGTRLVARLIKDGHAVTVLSRDRELHKHLLVLPGLTLENCDVYEEAQLSERFRGKDVVINLVGILNERGFGGGGFRRAHTELTRSVLQAMRSAGVRRLLQVSALKAAVDAPSYYLRSKGQAEKLIREQSAVIDWTIFQPSVMFGPGDTFLNRFAGLLASVPFFFPLARPRARFQPVFVDDVVDAMLRCLHGATGVHQTYQLGGPQVYTLSEIVHLVASITGRGRWIVGLPNFAAWLQGLVMNFVPGRPFSSDNYNSLQVDSVCTDDGFEKLKIKPHSMAAAARQYLGSFEDNARLSRDRAAAGKSAAGLAHSGGATAERP
ncbi:MAG: complex I NDUFA9 subunit family protein [Steroidobacteraceae bacterium]|jgi:NADH dehydrogenase